MSRIVKILVGIAALGGLMAVFAVALNPERDVKALPSPFIGKQAPSFELPTLQDPSTTVGSADLAGKQVLVNVWATWCVGCRHEHAFLVQLAKSGTIPIYGINWQDTRSDALRWLEQLGNPYVVNGFDHDGRVGIDWGVYAAPETFLVGADGTVLYKHLGPLSPPVWAEHFEPFLQTGGGAR